MRVALQDQRTPHTERSTVVTLPAPTKGWITNTNIAATPPGFAIKMDNFIAKPDVVELRKGLLNHTTGFTGTVKALMPYYPQGGSNRLFASTDAGVFDITTGGTVGSPVFSCASGQWAHANFSNSAGSFLLAVNGVDDLRYFDGTAWTSVATYGTIATNTLIGLTVYQQRLFFIQKNSLKVYFLPPGAITGVASLTAINVEQLFPRGGTLAAIGTWTVDGGAGTDDRLVVVTTEGEVAVFVGTDPSTASTWALVGRYYIARPIGRRCLHPFGGDLLILTERGVFPLSKALQSSTIDKTIALTFNIENTIAEDARIFGSVEGWSLFIDPKNQLLLVNVPRADGTVQYVMQLQSGGWSRFTGLPAASWATFNGKLLFGMSGKVAVAMDGGKDFDSNITGEVIYAYTTFNSSRAKFVKMFQPVLKTERQSFVEFGVLQDFKDSPVYTNVSAGSSGTALIWGSGVWGTNTWGGTATISKRWVTVPASGAVYIAPALRVNTSSESLSLVAVLCMLQQGTFLA